MKRPWLLALAAVVIVFMPAPASAQCIAGTITVAPATVRPGGSIAVKGDGFFVGCNDFVIEGQPAPPREPPDRGIKIQLRQGAKSVTLATVDAKPDYTFSVSVRAP